MKNIYRYPGGQAYVSKSLKVIKDDRCLRQVRYAGGYHPVTVWLRNGKPYASMHINGKDYCHPVIRLLFMA